VREKFSCRTCEAITQPSAPSHPIARGRAGPGLLAHILFAKYGLHLPLNRQSATYAREGIDLDISTNHIHQCAVRALMRSESVLKMNWIQHDHGYLALGLELLVGVGRPKSERLSPLCPEGCQHPRRMSFSRCGN
jgi:hypothetical protein